MAVWPVSLPQRFQGGGDYRETPENTVLRTTMDAGIIKLRRRQTRSISKIEGVMLLDGTQAGEFLTFFQDTTKGGSITFTGSLGRSTLNQVYQFETEPSISHIGGDTYQLTMSLIVLPT